MQGLLDASGCSDFFDCKAILCSIAPYLLVPKGMVRDEGGGGRLQVCA